MNDIVNLSVVGGGKLDLELDSPPQKVVVEFSSLPTLIPCNPAQDQLEWDLVTRNDGIQILRVRWYVVDKREISIRVNS